MSHYQSNGRRKRMTKGALRPSVGMRGPVRIMSPCRQATARKSESSTVLYDRRHEQLLAGYLLNLERGEWFVLQMMAADIRGFVDLGALELAADAFIVLRLFIEDRPRLRTYARQGRLGRLTWSADEFL